MRQTLMRKLAWLAAYLVLAVTNAGLARAQSVDQLIGACSAEIEQDVDASYGEMPNPGNRADFRSNRFEYWRARTPSLIQTDHDMLQNMATRTGRAGTPTPVEACLARHILGIQSPTPAQQPLSPEEDHAAAVKAFESTPHSPQFAAARRDAMEFCKKQLNAWEGFIPSSSPADLNLVVEGSFLEDGIVSQSVADLKAHSAQLSAKMADTSLEPKDIALRRVAICLLDRRAAQLEGKAGNTGLRTGVTPLRTGTNSSAMIGNGTATVVAGNGRSAGDCVALITLASGDSNTTGLGNRVLANQCSDKVEVVWCYTGGECERDSGSMWTIQPGNSWPVSATKELRWGACHGANTASFQKGNSGLRVICKAPLVRARR